MTCRKNINMIYAITFCGLLFVLLIQWIQKWRNPCCGGKLPPGSMGLPLLGETFQFFSPYTSFDISPFVKERMKRCIAIHFNKLSVHFSYKKIYVAHDVGSLNSILFFFFLRFIYFKFFTVFYFSSQHSYKIFFSHSKDLKLQHIFCVLR